MELSADIKIAAGADLSSVVPTSRTISTTAPLTGGGDLSADRTLGITQATAGTDGYLSATDWVEFHAHMTNPMTALGDIIYGGAAGAPTRLPTADGSNHVLRSDGSTPYWDLIDESNLSFTDVTTANATSLLHGLLPRLSGDSAQYLNGQGNWATPAASAVVSYSTTSFTGQTSVEVTHNFGVYPAVQVLDNTGALLIPQSVTHNTVNKFTVTFLVSTTGTIIATVGSPGAQNVVTVSTDYSITSANRIVKVTASGKNITLLTAVDNSGLEFVIDNASTGDITLWPQLYELIEGEASQTLPPDSAIHVYSDNVGWRIY